MKKKQSLLLIQPPLAPYQQPSYPLGRLKSVVTAEGHRCDCSYLNLDFISSLGMDVTKALIYSNEGVYTGEILYGSALFPDYIDEDEFVRKVNRFRTRPLHGTISPSELFRKTHRFNSSIIRRWKRDFPYTAVGISAIYELMPSLFFASAIKRVHPEVQVILGGPQFTDDVGRAIAEKFDFIDWAVDGEGERILVEILDIIADGSRRVPNSTSRRIDGELIINRAPQKPVILEELPLPDFDDYFSRKDVGKILSGDETIPIEASRGCWWSRCKFCSQPSWESARFRQPPIEKVVETMEHFARRYNCLNFRFVDSVQRKDADKLAAAISASPFDFTFYMSFRPDVPAEHLDLLHKAGLRSCHFGIESFSRKFLRIMDKGTSVLNGIHLLREASRLGIRVGFNIITMFPDENEDDFREYENVFSFIAHLCRGLVRQNKLLMLYGSPMYRNPAKYGVKSMVPSKFYRLAIPPRFRFTPTLKWDYQPKKRWRNAMPKWLKAGEVDGLLNLRAGGNNFCEIIDTRPNSPSNYQHYQLSSPYSDVLIECNSPKRRSELKYPDDVLEDLVETRLLFEEDGRYLSLPIRRGAPTV